MRRGNIRAHLPSSQAPEELLPLVQGAGTRIERIVSQGHASPPGFWYEQEQHEYVILLEGQAELEFEESGKVALRPGDWIDIPAGVRHRVTSTDPEQPTVWLAVFYD